MTKLDIVEVAKLQKNAAVIAVVIPTKETKDVDGEGNNGASGEWSLGDVTSMLGESLQQILGETSEISVRKRVVLGTARTTHKALKLQGRR